MSGPTPSNQLVPLIEVVHDRLNVEVFRGCTAGLPLLPGGDDHPAGARAARGAGAHAWSRDGLRRTGYDEVALTSLSTADFSGIDGLVAGLVNEQEGCGNVGLSLPSLRVDAFTVGIASEIQKVRRTGLTFAPEGGTWRLRQVINKLITEDDLYAAVEGAYSQGWQRVKLYFLIGLPTEMDEDTLGIAAARPRGREDRSEAHEEGDLHRVGRAASCRRPHTPFQWFGQNGVRELRRKVELLRDDLKRRAPARCAGTTPRPPSPRASLSRGDRRIGNVIERVWRAGGTFQEWSEHFALDRWLDAMAAEGLDPDWYVTRHRTEDEMLPWDHIAAGLHRDFLWDDWQEALREHGLPDCRWTPCYDCGVCTDYALEHVVASAVPPAGGSQGTGQGLGFGNEVRCVELVTQVRGDSGFPVRIALRQAGQGAVHLGTATSPAPSSAPSGSSSCRSPSPKGSHPARR